MTHESRQELRGAIDAAKRAWMEAQGGYDLIEREARHLERTLGHDIHGTRSRYVRGCRCEPCKYAYRVYCREWSRTRRFRQEAA